VRIILTKLLLTILLTLSLSSIASTKDDFKLKKSDISKSNIATIIEVKTVGSFSCDECSNVFQDCINSGEQEFICEILEEECYEECDSNC